MPAPLTAQQIALYVSQLRRGGRQEVAAAAAGISASSAHRWIQASSNPKPPSPRSRRRTIPLAEGWKPLLVSLLERHPALSPTILLKHPPASQARSVLDFSETQPAAAGSVRADAERPAIRGDVFPGASGR